MNSIKPGTELESVTELWNSLLPFDPPDKFTINLMLRQHGVETVQYAIEQTAVRRSKGDQMDRQAAIRLSNAICCSVTRHKQYLKSTT
jgi:hypothetical protein